MERMPVGVGSYVHYDQIDGIAQCRRINAFKGVSFGEGFKALKNLVAKYKMKYIMIAKKGYHRGSNHLGGFEGGMSNGMPIIVNG